VIVGCFDVHRAQGEPLTAQRCNEACELYFRARGMASPVHLGEDEVQLVRATLSELVWRWDTTAQGATLQLTYPDPSAPNAP
jgi:hypothetical protein